jgi:hypothetical protein
MVQLTERDLVTIPRSVVSTTAGEDTLVHDMITQQFYRLNDVGTRIWELIDSGHTIHAIIQTISGEYKLPDDVPASQLRDDVTTVVAELHRHGLVVISSPTITVPDPES